MKEYKITLSKDEMILVYRALKLESKRFFENYIVFRAGGFPASAAEWERDYEKIEFIIDKFYIDED